MTLDQFNEIGERLEQKFQTGGLPDYFRRHAPRLHRTCELFDLFSQPLGDVLEIGPFFGCTPFVLRPRCASYTVLEGDDPAVHPLKPAYEEYAIRLSFVDFFEQFGPTRSATHVLDCPDASFDTILCWETMEHFNFNPVKFVRELHRVLKPGGRACITVPNRASWQAVAGLITGKNETAQIQGYFQFENYDLNGKKAFYGFHWREYSPPELRSLFSQAGFEVRQSGSYNAFQPCEKMSVPRRMARLFARTSAALFSRHGTHVYLVASK